MTKKRKITLLLLIGIAAFLISFMQASRPHSGVAAGIAELPQLGESKRTLDRFPVESPMYYYSRQTFRPHVVAISRVRVSDAKHWLLSHAELRFGSYAIYERVDIPVEVSALNMNLGSSYLADIGDTAYHASGTSGGCHFEIVVYKLSGCAIIKYSLEN